MIINRYIILEIINPFAGMLAVLVAIFAAYSSAHFLASAAYGLMPVGTVITLILLKVAISLEVLLPTTLYLSVIVGLGRLYKDSEITALFAAGVGVSRVLKVVLALSLVVALLVGSLSLYARPWAYERSFLLKEKAKAEFDITRLKAGKFYEIRRGNQVIFIDKIDHQRHRAEGVFILNDSEDVMRVIYAKEAQGHIDRVTDRQGILFLEGRGYEFPRTGKGIRRAIEVDHFRFSLWPKEVPPLEYKIKAASTMDLVRSNIPSDTAELQWRLSAPLSAILLALLGVPLSRAKAREGKYAKIATAVLIYALYYGIGSMAKIWVEQGFVPTVPGIWWVQGLMAGLLFGLLLHPSQQIRSPWMRR